MPHIPVACAPGSKPVSSSVTVNILVTAGNTQTPIDRVRCITNIFTGKTGAGIALSARDRSHSVTLLTSHPEAVLELDRDGQSFTERWVVHPYRTFDDLHSLMAREIMTGGYDAVIHCAAVSDYLVRGVYTPAPGTGSEISAGTWLGALSPALADPAEGKIKSDETELWLRLVRAPKLIDRVRNEWGFTGVLVKFKLEVGVTTDRLLAIAEQSRRHSQADLMVANTLEGANEWAMIGPIQGKYEQVSRGNLASRLLEVVEQQAKSR